MAGRFGSVKPPRKGQQTKVCVSAGSGGLYRTANSETTCKFRRQAEARRAERQQALIERRETGDIKIPCHIHPST